MKLPDVIYGVAQNVGDFPMINTLDNLSFLSGDAANITVKISQDHGSYVTLTTGSGHPVEIDSTGVYYVILTAGEAEFRTASLLFTGTNIDEQLILLTSDMMTQLSRIPQSMGQTWFVNSNGGSDSNSGLMVFDTFETIGKVLDVATPQDTIRVAAGTYTESGLDLDTANVTIIFDCETILTGGGGTGLIVSAGGCVVENLLTGVAADQIGLQITGDRNKVTRPFCITGAIGIQIASGGLGNLIVGPRCGNNTSKAFDIQGDSNVIINPSAGHSSANTAKGYSFTGAGCFSNVVRNPAASNMAGGGYEFDADTFDNVFAEYYKGAGCGADSKLGTDNTVSMMGNTPSIDGSEGSVAGALAKIVDDDGGGTFDAEFDSLEKQQVLLDTVGDIVLVSQYGIRGTAVYDGTDVKVNLWLTLLGADVDSESCQAWIYDSAGDLQKNLGTDDFSEDAQSAWLATWSTAGITIDDGFYMIVHIIEGGVTYRAKLPIESD